MGGRTITRSDLPDGHAEQGIVRYFRKALTNLALTLTNYNPAHGRATYLGE